MAGLWVAACVLAGCGSNGGELYEQMQHEDPSVRLAAIHRAAELKDDEAVPFLVELLDDSESDVRFFAYVALKKITGQRIAYRAFDPLEKRLPAVRRWRQWVRQTRGESAATQPGKGGPS